MNISNNRIIFSLDTVNKKQNSKDILNDLNMLKEKKDLFNDKESYLSFIVTELIGYYKNEEENSFMIESLNYSTHLNMLAIIKMVAKSFNQESILVVDGNNQGKLIFLNGGKSLSLGRLIVKPRQELLYETSYSVYKDNPSYGFIFS